MNIDLLENGETSVSRGTLDPPCKRILSEMEPFPYMNLLEKYVTTPLYQNWSTQKSCLGGRGLFASKRIDKGTLIFENRPLVIGPRADCVSETYCSICYKICESYKCDKCKLLMCSKECEMSLRHHQVCEYIIKNWKSTQSEKNVSGALIYLHFILLRDEDKSLLEMFQRCIINSRTAEFDVLGENFNIPEKDIKFMTIVNSIIKINSFRIANRAQAKLIPLRGVYPLSSLLNHSCVPNTRNVFRNDNTMAIYAAKDINVGEEILTCYTGLLWSTPARRIQLYKTKGFWCKCQRCVDRTEMGTKLAALKCLDKECLGVLLPHSPLDPTTEWNCDNCGTTVSAGRICIVQSAVGSLVGTLDLDEEFRLESKVLERLSNFIPYCSHVFIDLRLRLALRIGTSGPKINELSECRLSLKESLCRGTLRTLAALGAGDAHLRGLLLYHLHAALAERARRSPDLYDELKSEIESSIEQAYNILQGDISAPPDLELRRRYLGPGCDKPQQERFFILDS